MKAAIEKHIETIFVIEILLLSFLLPLNQILFTYTLIPTLLTTIFLINFKGLGIYSLNKKWIILFILPYISACIGLFYSDNKSAGLFDLEVKFSILLMPLILSIIPSIKKQMKISYLTAYIAGCFVATSVCILYAIYWFYNVQQDIYCFYYTRFSILFHPTYFSLYLNIACGILIWRIISEDGYSKLKKIIYSLLFAYFLFAIILLSSKTGIITLFLILIFALIYFIIVKKKYLFALVASSLFIISFVVFIRIIPFSTLRIKLAISELISSNNNNFESNPDSVRILTWKSSLQLIKENTLFGTGNGDAKDELILKYKENKAISAVNFKLNAHNQFLQTFVELGLFGFIILLLSLLIPTYFALKTKNFLYLIFILVFAINMLTESMFNTRSGVLFYSFINSLLFFSSRLYL